MLGVLTARGAELELPIPSLCAAFLRGHGGNGSIGAEDY